MRAFFLASAALAACGSMAAVSADMPVKAPPITATTSWSGFYLGGHLGYGYAVTRWRVRADYQYFITRSVSFTVPGEETTPATAKAKGQSARLGVVYQLGGP